MVTSKTIFRALVSFCFIAAFCASLYITSDDDFWKAYDFDAKGVFQLVSVTHVTRDNSVYSDCSIDSQPGSVSASCSSEIDGQPATGSGKVTWDAPPATAKEGRGCLMMVFAAPVTAVRPAPSKPLATGVAAP